MYSIIFILYEYETEIKYITIIITLEGNEKLKSDNNVNKTVWTIT